MVIVSTKPDYEHPIDGVLSSLPEIKLRSGIQTSEFNSFVYEESKKLNDKYQELGPDVLDGEVRKLSLNEPLVKPEENEAEWAYAIRLALSTVFLIRETHVKLFGDSREMIDEFITSRAMSYLEKIKEV